MQRRAIAELTDLLRDKLGAAELPAADMRGYVTPRRLTVIAWGIPAGQPDRSEERRGPRLGAPTPAIEGFLRSAGIASIGECEIRDTGRGEFYFATIDRPGRPAAEVLPELVRSAIFELPWPKSMRYPASSLRWVRPLTSVVFLFEGEILPLPLDRVPVGRTTRGHRFLAPGEICVANAAEYLEHLGEARVVLDQDRRKETIRRDLEATAAGVGLILKPDPALLDEVTGLVEFPVVLVGAIDAEYMALPPEVLATAMRTHQKYFSCLQVDGTPAPRSCSLPTMSPWIRARRSPRAISAYCGRGSPMTLFLGPGPARSARESHRVSVAAGISRQARQPLKQGRANGAACRFSGELRSRRRR